MTVSATVREVFSHFENLNLLGLLHDLREGRTARQAWLAGSLLCPIAHGLPAGQQVREVSVLGQSAHLSNGCDYAARYLGADPDAVLRFVRCWDEELIGREVLLRQIEELWQERLEDALFMQQMLQDEAAPAGSAEGYGHAHV